MIVRLLLLSSMLAWLAGCDAPPEQVATPEVSLEIVFMAEEPGVDPYPSRMLVTNAFVRLDDGVDSGNFVLFDRAARTIAAVSHTAQNVLWIYPHAVQVTPPIALEHSETSERHPEAPRIAGMEPVQYRFSTNGELCYEVLSVQGLLEAGRIAMGEYLEVLAGEQALNMDKTPPEMQSPCGLARNIFAPTRHLAHGFPVQEWDPQGHSRSLVSYREGVAFDPALFQIPADYAAFSVNPADPQ